MTVYHGPLHYFSETGIGPDLTLQDQDFITVGPHGEPRWSYHGVRPIRVGDRLTIRHPETDAVVFNKKIKRGVSAKVAPKGWQLEDWLKMFFDKWPATLTPAASK